MVKDWMWLPIAPLYICDHLPESWGARTYVNGYIISTVRISTPQDRFPNFPPLSPFESIVFKAIPNTNSFKDFGVPYALGEQVSDEIKYDTGDEAQKGHIALCKQYDKEENGNNK